MGRKGLSLAPAHCAGTVLELEQPYKDWWGRQKWKLMPIFRIFIITTVTSHFIGEETKAQNGTRNEAA